MQFSVLIAEDERIERESLAELLKKEYPDKLQVRYTASNGLFALKYLLSNPVDILFLDIRMPIMDGMDIMREVRKSNRDLEIIVVSAYSDFEYARTAVSHGAADYLLKPYTLESLKKGVERVLDRLSVRERSQQFVQVKEEQQRRLRDMLNRDLINTIFYSRSVPSSVEFSEFVSLLDLPSQRWVLTVLRFTENSSPPDTGEWEKLLRMYRGTRKNSVVYGAGREMISLDFISGDEVPSRREQFGNYCIRFCREELGRDALVAVSGVQHGPDGLLSVYSSLIKSLSGPVLPEKSSELTGIGVDVAEETASLLIRGNRQGLQHAMDLVGSRVNALDRDRRAGFLRSYLTLLRGELFKRLSGSGLMRSEQVLSGLIEQVTHADAGELHHSISGINRLLGDLQGILDGSHKAVTARIKSYIMNHLSGDLSIEQLAATEDISASHLSRIFKEVEGTTLNRWVVKIRMEKGAEILHTEGCSVKSAARRVGIQDPNYFTRLYKKEFGASPTGLRQNSRPG